MVPPFLPFRSLLELRVFTSTQAAPQFAPALAACPAPAELALSSGSVPLTWHVSRMLNPEMGKEAVLRVLLLFSLIW